MKKAEREAQMTRKLNRIKNIYYLLIGLLTWLATINFAGLLSFIFSNIEFSLVIGLIEATIFACLLGGAISIYKKIPPFHNFVLIGAVMEILFSITLFITSRSFEGILRPILAILILYFGIRYPLSLDRTLSSLRSDI